MRSPFWFVVGLFIAYLICAALDSDGKTYKFYPATRDSVLIENEYADAMHAHRYLTQGDVEEGIFNHRLTALYNNNIYRLAPQLPIERGYALPNTVKFLNDLAMDHYHQFHRPLVVDSAIRPAKVQRSLMHRNHCAAPAYGERASTHERGTTLDLSNKMSRTEYRWMVVRLGYYRALGRVLVIEEKNCWHLFVIGEMYGQ